MSAKKVKHLLIIALIYLVAYTAGVFSCFFIPDVLWRMFVFDVVATIVTFIFSAALKNSSVYDAYWSLTPMVMSVRLFYEAAAWSPWQIAFLVVFNLWSLRLTLNWVAVFTDFSYEDWRYRKYRDENPPVLWWIINFFGIHMVPTVVVFAGMLPLFEIVKHEMDTRALLGIVLILLGVALEFFADRAMHAFLADTREKVTCRRGLWGLSRHPNYLGEITVWLGVYVTMLPFAPEKWWYGIGFVAVAVLFNVVSIPLMEKRQLARRSDYADYRHEVPRLLPIPKKK